MARRKVTRQRNVRTRIGSWLEAELVLRQLRRDRPGGVAVELDSMAKAMGLTPTAQQQQDDRALLGEAAAMPSPKSSDG